MVQNLNNNLITAPELSDLRKKLRTWDSRVCALRGAEKRCTNIRLRMDRHFSLRFFGLGVTMQSLHSPSACLRKPTSRPTIYYIHCKR